MNPLCGILTNSIRELGKKHGINNEIYLKGLYTRWATTHTNDEVFDDKALLDELSLDSDKVDKLHLNEFGVIPSYEAVRGVTPENGNIAGVNKEGNIKLYVDSINSIEDFLKYISGKKNSSATSLQKAEVLKVLSKDGVDLRFFEDLLKSKKDILAFILFHEKSHVMHRDSMNYDVNDLLGENQINIETRATLDAIEEFKEWKKKQNEKTANKQDTINTFNLSDVDTSKVDVEEHDKPWRDKPEKKNKTIRIYLKEQHDKGYFELVKDEEYGQFSVHFKTAKKGAEFNTEGMSLTSKEERKTLFQELIKLIPEGATVSTWGTLSRDGVKGLKNIGRDMQEVGERTVKLKEDGSEIKIPIYKKLSTETNINQEENLQDELPENVIEKSPVGTNVIEHNLNTPKAKLNNVLLANVQIERAKLIANQFYQICDEYIEEKKKEFLEKGDFQTVLEWGSSAIGRAKALRYIDVKNLIEDLHNSFKELADISIDEMVNEWGLSLEEAEHRKIHYNIIVDHFAPLLEMACPQIEKDCGLRLAITANQVSDGKDIKSQLGGTFIDMSQSYNENPNMQDNDEGARTNGNDGWSYKARQTDPHSTISLVTKNILRKLPQLDNNGRPLKDDLGNTKYLDEEFAHALLIQGLGNMINSNDFCIVTETEDGKSYEFPELTQLALKYPWVENIIEHLSDHPEDIPAFYTDFRNNFIAYYKLVDNKLVSMNQASTNGSSVMIQVKRDYEQGNPLSDNPIYNSLSEINNENIKHNQELLKDVQEELQYLDTSDEDEVVPILEKVLSILRSIGVDVNFNDVNALWHLGNNQSGFKEVLGSVSTILDKAHSAEAGALITLLNSDYVEIAKKLSKVTELENLSSFREGDKTYYSFSAPNFADIQIAYFKSDKYRDQYLTENFSQFKWFTTKEGVLRNGWIKQIATNDYIRQNIDTIELKNINGIEYEDWTGEMIDKAFISAFFSKYKSESNIKFGYYHYPIFSDSPVAKFIKMVRYHDNVEENIIPLLREVVKQELFRIDHVNKRAKTEGVSKIGNYDKVGRKFCFFPALNNYMVGDKSFLDACNEKYNDEDAQNAIIDSALKEIMDEGFTKFVEDSGLSISEKDLKDWGIDDMSKIEALHEYYWNSVYAQTQIIQMTVTDLAFYKDATDFQKRYKEVYAAGKRLFTNSKYGRKNENVIYLADYVRTSTAYDRFKVGLTKALNEGRINKMDYDSILYKFRNVNVTDAQGFRTLESYRSVLDMMGQWTPVMEDAVTKMLNKEWDMSHFNVIWQTIKPFLFSTTVKPDGLGDIMKVNHQNKDSEFLLLAVMDMISASADSPQIQALNEFMLANNIDLALYESGCKAGKQGVIDINYNYKKIAELKKDGSIRVGERVFNLHVDKWNPKLSDIENIKNILDDYLDKGTILQGEYNSIFDNYLALTKEEILEVLEESVKVKEPQDPRFNRGERPNKDSWFNPNVVHTFSYEDYMIAQPTPEHLLDAETIFGSQFRNLIISDLPADFECEINGVKYNRKEVHDLYNSLIISNLIDAFGKIKEEFKDIHAIQRKLMSMVQDNAKFDRDIVQALEIVKVTNPLTGQEEETFNIPLNNPSTTEKLQQLILSAFKNGITKQYIRGGNAILVSDIGYTKELNVVKKKDGTLVGVECYLPATSKDFFEPLLKTVTKKDPKTGEIIGTYQILDFNELDNDLKQAIGYRI